MFLALFSPSLLFAAITGSCAECHTMHNSQNGQEITTIGGGSGPFPSLTKGSCLGCHARNSGQKIVPLGSNQIPQVYHKDSQDLAAGNFAYIDGAKPSTGGASDRKGHNVFELVGVDETLTSPPGWRHGDQALSDLGNTTGQWLTCAGTGGCHGMRGQLLSEAGEFGGGTTTWRVGVAALSGYNSPTQPFSGAHHNNYDGLKQGSAHPNYNTSPLSHSYRFIRGLKGYGNLQDRWQNLSSESHNEYYGVSLSISTCSYCHTGGTGGLYSALKTPGSTMTGFCITCHTDFHSTGTAGTTGFFRHPSDFIIKNSGEYTAYTTYNINAPVARATLSASSSSVVKPGSDLVMCLSCHVAHGSPYSHMLRWDYDAMNAHNAGEAASTGCFICHTTKDE